MKRFLPWITLLLVVLVGAGVFRALRSPIFAVRSIEFTGLTTEVFDTKRLQDLTGINLGAQSLFSLKLPPLREKLMQDPWMKDVSLYKRPPSTLRIQVTLREPAAFFQDRDGSLSYLDSDGVVFDRVNLENSPDLPLLSGFDAGDAVSIKQGLVFLNQWQKTGVSARGQISTLSWGAEEGFKALVVFSRNRTILELGQKIDDRTELGLNKLDSIVQYLDGRSIHAQRIFISDAKKIVVRTAHGS